MDASSDQTVVPFIVGFQDSELKIAAEFLRNWLPFLAKDLCHSCTQILSDRVRSLDPEHTCDAASPPSVQKLTDSQTGHDEFPDDHEDCDTHSLGSWKDGANGTEDGAGESSSVTTHESATINSPSVRMSWADMAQEDELEEEEEGEEANKPSVVDERRDVAEKVDVRQKPELSRDQREYIRFMNVQRKKDFICLERINGKIVNILDGLELHTGIFSAAEQKRIVNFVYTLQQMGTEGKLRDRTYSAPKKWMRGKGRVTIQFGCCYNYATDKRGNPPGILRNEVVDPIPSLFKVIIRRLVGWHVLPPSCVPDSCIVNIYEGGDCIPPHIDNHDFERPFCTVSFLSECNILFGSNLEIVGPGDFAGPLAIPLPIGSVLVFNGNGADISKHCVPAVPTKRISITFRKMVEAKRPVGFVPEPDLQGLQPLQYDADETKVSNPSKPRRHMNRQTAKKDGNSERQRGPVERGTTSEPRYSAHNGPHFFNSRKARLSLGP